MNPHWTYDEYQQGLCTDTQVGHPKDVAPLATPPASPETLVQTYLDVFDEIGGKKSLVEFARKNPMKFYDQLLKLLIALEAPPPRTQINIANITDADMHRMSLAELTQLLLDSGVVSPTDAQTVLEGSAMRVG